MMQRTEVDIERAIQEATQRIVRDLKPVAVILFGSRARGDARAQSDVDLLIVLPDGVDRAAGWRKAQGALGGLPFDCDVVTATPELLERRGNMVGSVFLPALREGRVLFKAGDWQVRQQVSEEDKAERVQEWMQRAERDLRSAGLVLEDGDPGGAAYLAQQAAEKAIKAVLVSQQIEYPYVHVLDQLMERVPEGWEVKQEGSPSLMPINQWAAGGHYPDSPFPEPDTAQAEEALRRARAILDAARRDLTGRGFVPAPSRDP